MRFFNKSSKKLTNQQSVKSIGYGNVVQIGEPINKPYEYEGQQIDEKLINEGYVSNADVYSIIKKISETSADIPWVVEQQTMDGWELDEESMLNNLINQPNPEISGRRFRYDNGIYLLNTGDNFWRKTTSTFDLITELHILEPNLTDLNLDVNNDVEFYEYTRKNAILFNYPAEDVLHLMYLNPSCYGIESNRGLSPLQAGYNVLKSSNNRMVAEASMLSNRGASGILSSGSDLSMTPDQRSELQKWTDRIIGKAKNFAKIIATTANVTYTPIGMSANDLKMIEGGLVNLRQICNIYGVDSTMFNDKASSTLDNVKVANKKLYTDAAIPLNEFFIAEYDKSIIPAYNSFENKTLRIRQDISGIEALQEDQRERAEKDARNVATTLSILTSPISNESKIQTLILERGLEEETARLIVGTEIVEDETI